MAKYSDHITTGRANSDSRDAIVEAGVQKAIDELDRKGIEGAATNKPLQAVIRQHLELVRQEASVGIPAWESTKCHANVQPFQEQLVALGLKELSPLIHSSTAQGTKLVVERTEAARGAQL